jgi:hypothetical protein
MTGRTLTQISGKLVIISILVLGLMAAGVSWWFRYSATHRTAEFYGPEVRLIRSAPIVELLRFEPISAGTFQTDELDRFLHSPTNRRDISSAPGLTHLRNALLEDRSYIWPPRPLRPDDTWQWILIFRNNRLGAGRILLFSPDWQLVTEYGIQENVKDRLIFRSYEIVSNRVISCKPISEGLKLMLEGLVQESP